MSQLSKIKVIVFMIIFILICATGTFFAIKYVNDNNMENAGNNSNAEQTLPIDRYKPDLPDNSYLGIKLGDKYWYNNIELIEQVETDVINAEYYQISGLKNKEIENKINNEIKTVIQEEIEKAKHVGDIVSTTYANYSNVISICVHGADGNVYLNYDLTTGNKLKFTDLFVNNCEDIILKQIKERAKENWVERHYGTGTYDPQTDTYIYDESKYEKYLHEIVNEYTNNKENISFFFREDSVVIIINDLYAWISMKDMYQYISIFKKYVTEESIFEKGNLQEKYCLMEYSNSNALYFEEYNDNLFLNVVLYAYNDTIVKQHYLNYIQNKVELLKQNSDEDHNSAKFLYISMDISTAEKYTDKYTGLSQVNWTEYEYTMPKSEYVDSFRQKMLEANMQTSYNPLVKEYNKEKVSSNIISKKMYTYVDKSYGEIQELSLKDVFVEEYDYVAVAKERIKQYLDGMQRDEYERKYMNETFGEDVFEKILSDLEKIQNIDFSFNLGGLEFEYNFEYNNFIAVASFYEPYIYITNIFDMSKMK